MKTAGIVFSILSSLVWFGVFLMVRGFSTESPGLRDRLPLTAILAFIVALVPVALTLFVGFRMWLSQEPVSTVTAWLPLMSIPVVGGICFLLLVVFA